MRLFILATFNLPGHTKILNNWLAEWRILARKGHELGNHTLYPPYAGNRSGRALVTADYREETIIGFFLKPTVSEKSVLGSG